MSSAFRAVRQLRFLLLFAVAPAAFAATNYFADPNVSGSWTSNTTWRIGSTTGPFAGAGSFPGSAANDTANISGSGTSITLSSTIPNSLSTVTIGSGSGILVDVQSGGQLDLGGTSTINSGATLRVNAGGTILINGSAMTINSGGLLQAFGGTINGGGFGSMTIGSGGQFYVGTSTVTVTNGLSIINSGGTITQNGAVLAINSTSTVTNTSGTIDIQDTSGITSDNLATSITINGGSLSVSGGSGTVPISIQVNTGPGGTVSTSAADIHLGNGGTHQGSLAANTPGGRINLSGATTSNGSSWSGSANHRIALLAGTLTLVGTTSGTNFALDGGTVQGAGTLTVIGTMDWTGGSVNGSSGTIQTNGLTVTGANGAMSLQNMTVQVNNQFTYTGTGTGLLTIGTGGTIHLPSGSTGDYSGGSQPMSIGTGGVLQLDSGSSFNLDDDSLINGTGTINGAGSFQKNLGSATSTINCKFNNTGSVYNLVSGTSLAFAGGGTHSGLWDTFSGGNKIAFSGGTHTFNAGTSFGGTGVFVVQGGTFDLDVAAAIPSGGGFTQEGGTVTGSGNLTINGVFTWSGGTQDTSGGTGQTILANVSSVINGNTAAMILSARTMVNNATLAYSPSGSNYLSIDFGGTLQNNSTFNITGDFPINTNNIGTPKIKNLAGTMNKTGGSGTASINPPLELAATLNVSLGSIAVFNGGLSGSTISVPASSNQFIVSGGTFQMNSGTSVTGSGAVSVNGGATILTLNTPLTINNVKLQSGTINGTTLTIASSLTWQGGTFQGPGTTTINAAASVDMTTPTLACSLDNRTFDNNGTFNYTPNAVGALTLTNGATFNNKAGANFNILSNFQIGNGSGSNTFTNAGTVTKSAGTSGTRFDMPVTNTGTITCAIANGTIIFANGGSMSTGSMSATVANAAIHFFGGTYTLSGGVLNGPSGTFAVLGTGTLAFNASIAVAPTFSVQSGGTVDVGSTRVVALNGPFSWTGGTFQNSGQTRILGGGTIGGGGNALSMTGGTMTIETAVNYDADATNYLTLTGTSTLGILNGGTLTLHADNILAGNSPAGLSVNNGTLTKTLGSGVSRVDLPISVSGTGGTITTSSGTIHFKSGGGVFGNTAFNVNGSTKLQFEGVYTINAGSTVAGTGTVELSSGTLTVTPNVTFAIYDQNGGTLTGSGNVTVKGGTWAAGDINAGGTFDVFSGSTFTINGAGTKNLRRNFTNSGTVQLQNPASLLQFENAITFANNGTLAFQDDASIGCTCGSPSTLTNTSVVTKTGGTSASNIAAVFNNTAATVTVASTGLQLNFNNGGTHTGSFSGVSGASIGFSGTHSFGTASNIGGSADILFGGTEAVNGTYALASGATTMIYAGTATFGNAGGASTPRLYLNGGTLAGAANFTINGGTTSLWTSGTVIGTGAFTINSGSTLDISGSAGAMLLDGRTLTNNGTLNYTATTSTLTLDNSASIVNGNIFNVTVASAINVGTGSGTIVNNGTFNRTTAAGNMIIAPAFTNTSNVSLQAGTTTFNSYAQSAGNTDLAGGSLASGTTVNLTSGTLTGFGTVAASLTNSGTILPGVGLTTGTITLTGNYSQTSTGKLEFDIGGTTPSTQYDVFSVNGQPGLSGELKVNLINAFVPSNGQTFDVFGYTTAPVTDFTTNTLPSFGAGGSFTKSYQPATLRLTAVVPTADVQITQANSGAAHSGDTVTFTVDVKNNDATFTASAVSLTNNLTGPQTFVSASPTAGSCTGPNCSLGNIAPGATVTVTVTVTATSPGTISNTASSTSTTTDPNAANNTNIASSLNVAAKASVFVAITDSPDPVNAGANVTYNVALSNGGPDAAANASLALNVTNGSITSTSGGPLSCTGTGASASCTAASLGVGSFPPITVNVTAGPSGSVSLTASFTSTTFDANTANDTATESTAITPQADVSIVKSGPVSASPGTIVYTVTVTNNGPSTASSVSVADPTPPGLTFVSNSGACTTAYPCSLGSLNNAQTAVISSTYTVPANASGTITNTATVSSSTADPNNTNNSSTVVTPVNQTADLQIVKSGPASIVAGAPITYTLTITNNGPSDATSVTVTDPAPSGLTFVSNSGACTTAFPCTIPTILAGGTATITSTFNTAPSLTAPIINSAGVSSAIIDPNGTNNNSSVTTTVTQSADLQITKSGPASATTGNVTYTITVTNNGPSNAAGVSVADPTPAGMSFVSNTGGCTTAFPCTIGALGAGSSVSITSTFNAAPSTSGNVTNTATVSATTADSNGLNNSASATTTINAQADLQITKSGPASVAAGTTINYTIAVKNNGPSDATNVTVSDPTPAGLTFAGTSGACSGSFPCVIPSITNGSTATITATYFVSTGSGSVSNTATVSFAGDTNSTNNSSTTTTTVTASADVQVTKSGPANAPSGSQVDYAIAIKNNGPSTATNVVLSDPTPAGASLVSVTGACTSFPCTIPTLLSGQTVGVSAKYTVTAGSGGSITNTASVTATTPDPNTSNNSASITTATDCLTTIPTPLTPANNATNVPTTGRLTWDNVVADFYSIYLGRADQNGCSTPFGNSDTSSFSYSNLAPNTKYIWKVDAFVNNCPVRTSSCFTFTTGANCNTTITLVKPISGSATSPVEFEWVAVSGATDYTVFAKTGNGNFLEVGKTTSTKLTASLTTDGAVQWYVVANIPGCGNVQSSTATFNLCTRPSTPIARVVGEATSAKTYRAEWDDVPNAIRYEVDEATNANFTGATTTSVTTNFASFKHDATDTPLAFFYRVRAFSACSPSASDNSPTVRIVIIPLPKPDASDLNTNIPAGSTEVVVQQVFIPGIPGVTAFFNAIADRPWLTVRPPNGVLPPEGITLEVTADPKTLPNGTFTATVIVTITTPGTSGANGVSTNGTTTTSKPVSISLVTPVTPVQNKITPNADSLIIPSVGHLDGVNSHWQSDIRVTNVGLQAAKYALTFTPSTGTATGTKQTTISVGPGETTALDDIIKNWYGIGSLGDGANGTLEIRAADSVPFTAVASSRTYDVTSNGTLGQFIPALPFGGFIGKAAQNALATALSMQQVAQSSLYRTNVGVVEASGNPASVLMSVFNATGSKLIDIPVDLKGGEQKQLNSVLAANNITLADGRIEVKVTGGDGKVTAYASVVDNATNDPLLVSGVRTDGTGSSKYVLPGVADLSNGLASWRTDMRIFNTTLASQATTLTLFPLGGGPALNTSLTLQPGEVRTLDDVVKSVFHMANIGGAVHVQTTTAANLVVTGRTYNQTTDGTFGQFIEAVTPAQAVGTNGRTLHVLQVEDSTRFRTNLGIAEVNGQPVTVEVSVVLPDSKVTPTITFQMGANEFRQMSVIRDLNLGNVYNARLTVRVIEGQGRIAAYGSVVDMTTQDPTYVPAQ